MQRRVSLIVSLQHVLNEDILSANELQTIQRIVFAGDVEDGLVFVVSHVEVVFALRELLFKHWQIVLLQSVVKRQGTVVVRSVGSWVDLVNDRVLLAHAHNVFDGPTLVVLHATSLVILVGAHKPTENLLVAVTSTWEQKILPESISLEESRLVVLTEDGFDNLEVLSFNSQKEWRLALVVLNQTLHLVD